MRKDVVTIQPLQSSFLAYSKDIEKILSKLFVESRPYSDYLKRLLVINQPDCLDPHNNIYTNAVTSLQVSDLRNQGYIRFSPKIKRGEFEEVKAYIIITFDNFSSNIVHPYYKDCTLSFDIVCHTDMWELTDYQVRPLAIVGYIDGVLNLLTNQNKQLWGQPINNIKLSGMGEYRFLGCKRVILDEDLSLYNLSYRAMYFSEDSIPNND